MRISSFDISLLILYARNSSRNLRVTVCSEFRYMILMYCWVMVEPPCRSPPRRITQAARNMPRMETPWSVQKSRFSAATTPSLTFCGISSKVSGCRFWTAKLPSWDLPLL